LKKIIIVLFGVLLIPFTGYANKDTLTIGLEYKPREEVKVNPKKVPANKIYFESIEDARSNSKIVGENQEHKDKVTIKSSIEPSSFVRSVLIKEFRKKKFPVEDSSGEAAKIISGTLLKFWTVETSVYDSQTQIRLEVKDRGGRVHFSRTYSGTGKNRGRSLNDTNYEESIGNSMISLIDKILGDSEFLSALSERSSPPASEVKTSVSAGEAAPSHKKKGKKGSSSSSSKTEPAFGPR
jgi:uncharacterized lipoprotein YajG